MTVPLNLSPEFEAALRAQAKASGMTVLSVVEGAVLSTPQQALSADQRAAAYEAWANGHRSNTPLLSDYAVSRESIYEGRGA
jgi:hypothetical protein